MDILKRFEQKGYKLVAMKVRWHAGADMGVKMPCFVQIASNECIQNGQVTSQSVRVPHHQRHS